MQISGIVFFFANGRKKKCSIERFFAFSFVLLRLFLLLCQVLDTMYLGFLANGMKNKLYE